MLNSSYITDRIIEKKERLLKAAAAKDSSFMSSSTTTSCSSSTLLSPLSLLKKDAHEMPQPGSKKSMFSLKCNSYYNKIAKEDNKKCGCLSMSKKNSCCGI